MNFEQWLKRPVYVAQCKAYRVVCDAAERGEISWDIASRMHMLKEPKLNVSYVTDQSRATHIRWATEARSAAVKLLRQWRKAQRSAPSGMELTRIEMMDGQPVRCYREQ